jgi:hypothetical protein
VTPSCRLIFLASLPLLLGAQDLDRDQVARILQRLDALEQQNRQLLSEIRSLREELAQSAQLESPAPSPEGAPEAGSRPPAAERLAVSEQQISDLAQSTVQSEHRDPVQLTGMVLFNAFHNGSYAGGSQYPVVSSLTSGQSVDGASLRQTILGIKFQAPEKIAGMDVSGSAYMDFFAGTATSLNQLMRLRVASLDFAWNDTTFTIAQDKPILAPREPDSLAQVGYSPLTGSGNLWLWGPQARIEQRFHFTETAGLRAQIGVYQTTERANVPSEYASIVSGARPALEGRFVFWKQAGQDSRFEIAPGFHVSDTHLAGFVIPSRIVSLDWRVPLSRKFDITGTLFHGENMGVIGGLQQGVAENPEDSFRAVRGSDGLQQDVAENSDDSFRAVRGSGGWLQLRFLATSRLTFDLFGGQEDDLNRDLVPGGISKNQTYGANAIYRVMSNVLTSFEWSYLSTTYAGGGVRTNPHYDLAFAYLF